MSRPLLVTLSHVKNPDIFGGYWHQPIDAGKPQRVAVENLSEACAVCRDFIRRNELGAGNWNGGRVTLHGRTIARISYNGRAWPPGSWTPGMLPLTDRDLARAVQL